MDNLSKDGEEQAQGNAARPSVKEYFKLGPVFSYWFRKKDPSRPTNINLRMMHGINKISMAMFLIAFIIWIVKRLS